MWWSCHVDMNTSYCRHIRTWCAFLSEFSYLVMCWKSDRARKQTLLQPSRYINHLSVSSSMQSDMFKAWQPVGFNCVCFFSLSVFLSSFKRKLTHETFPIKLWLCKATSDWFYSWERMNMHLTAAVSAGKCNTHIHIFPHHHHLLLLLCIVIWCVCAFDVLAVSRMCQFVFESIFLP